MENVNAERQGRKILLNISGQHFITTLETLSKYPDTRLGRLVNDNSSSHHFYEGDPDIFKEILSFTGVIGFTALNPSALKTSKIT